MAFQFFKEYGTSSAAFINISKNATARLLEQRL